MKVLVLGGTGAMGMSLVPLLKERGDSVYVTSRKQGAGYRGAAGGPGEIHYLTGNAHEDAFLRKILEPGYDAIVDFMAYGLEEFRQKADIFLASCGHYLFLSSSRVYAGSSTPLTEESPRLLDACEDPGYLKTSEYALDKAREEDILREKQARNYTIIRPYITYNSNRLQLGCYEKEDWLYRALSGKTIVFTEDMAVRRTTLTYGEDVAAVVSRLIGNENAYGETFHIASDRSITWRDVLKIYLEAINDVTGKQVPVLWLEDSKRMETVLSRWQIRYDRMYDRTFDSSKADKACKEEHKYTEAKEGLAACLKEFLADGEFKAINWGVQAYLDRLAHERADLTEIISRKQKFKYLICRYTPYLWVGNRIRCLKFGK